METCTSQEKLAVDMALDRYRHRQSCSMIAPSTQSIMDSPAGTPLRRRITEKAKYETSNDSNSMQTV